MAVDTKTARKSADDQVFVVKSEVIGTHPRPDAPGLQPKEKGERVTRAELGKDCDVDRLVALGAIVPATDVELAEVTA